MLIATLILLTLTGAAIFAAPLRCKAWVALACTPLVASVALAFATPWALAGLVAAPLIFVASRPVTGNAKGPALIPVLGMAGRAMLLWAVVTALALALG